MDSPPGDHGMLSSSQPAPTAPPSSWDHDKDHNARRPSSQSALLPPLELTSSSPGLPNVSSTRRLSRPNSSAKGSSSVNNKNAANSQACFKYPTPVPTSETGILSSSPPRRVSHSHDQHRGHAAAAAAAAAAATATATATTSINTTTTTKGNPSSLSTIRAPSTASERAPLSAVPSVELNENGETLLMGRSSNSSHYQLSANRLISRVHVKARYVPASVPLQANQVEVECNGWNGLRLSCQGRTYDMHRGDVLTFDAEGAEIIVDVQDARVLLHWPKRDDGGDGLTDLGWEDSPRSMRNGVASPARGGVVVDSPRAGGDGVDGVLGLGLLQSSPLRRTARISSPESPTPAAHAPASSQHSSILSDLPSASEREQSVEIYEDDDDEQGDAAARSFITDISKSFSSDLSEIPSDNEDRDGDENAENNPDEENEPLVHSFGPFGHDLNSRMASFNASSPKRRRLDTGTYISSPRAPSDHHRTTSKSASIPHGDGDPADDKDNEVAYVPDLSHVNVATITNHVINQLAFSRLSSNPLSTLLSNLPADDKVGLARDELRYIVENTTCVGTIPRQGKDADGKPLESQYYYVPERDDDESRRAAVVDGLRKPTLRNCRKHHVQYYWKRPRTP